jgi:hypothetical protein
MFLKPLEREEQNPERFRPTSFSAGPSASSRRSSGSKTAVRISTAGKEILTQKESI